MNNTAKSHPECITVKFSKKTKRGRKPLSFTPRRERVYALLGGIPMLPEEVLTPQHYVGNFPNPVAFSDAKKDLLWLVANGYAEMHLPHGYEGEKVRCPIEPEIGFFRKAQDESALRNGFMVDDRTPYRLNNVLFRRTAKTPNGHAKKLLSIYDCLPDTHHVRLEHLRLTTEAEEAFPTPAGRFEALLNLHRAGSVEIEADAF